MKIITALVVVLITAVVLAQAASSAPMAGMAPIVVSGFQTPESVLYDARGDVYLVSNRVLIPMFMDNKIMIQALK